MFTLIKREIRDHVIYFIAAVILSLMLTAYLGAGVYHFDQFEVSIIYYHLSIPVIVITVIGFCAMGVSQMYLDRNRKISAFLSVLPVSRNQILAARIITGLLAILTTLLPLMLAAFVLFRLLAPPIPILTSFLTDISMTLFLTTLSCYCVGLLTGWTSSKTSPTFGALGLTLILALLIPVKGFGFEIKLILVLVMTMSLVRTWQKFISTSL